MARLSYLQADGREAAVGGDGRLHAASRRGRPAGGRRGPGRYVALVLVLLAMLAVGAGAVVVAGGRAGLEADGAALARITLPTGGGTVTDVSVHGAHDRLIRADLRDGRIWPRDRVAVHEAVSVQVTVKRPGWIAWLAGAADRVTLRLNAPSSGLREHYLTLAPGRPLRLAFSRAVATISYGPPGGQLVRRTLSPPVTSVTLPRSAEAGTISVAAAPRAWESARPALVSWFPSGAKASAVALPAPGTVIAPRTALTLTFSTTVRQALGSVRPALTPATSGTWRTVSSHTLQFVPTGLGYGLAAHVTVGLPAGVRLVGGSASAGGTAGSWHVPAGTTLRLQQILAQLGYLPLRWSGPSPGADTTAQQEAAVHPATGQFTWRYANTPASLRGLWSPGSVSVVTRGALMAFQNAHGLAPDGSPGPGTWKALIAAAVADHPSSLGYTYVMVSKAAQKLTLWHSGRTVMTTAVNTGIPSAPTAGGTFPVFEHIRSGTMSGRNPDGSHYNDPGIQYISYFNGGDALHAFTRAQYGSPQSLGCVEMATEPAGRVYPYTPIGTLVHVE